jgi:two-component system, cell cycle response regulator DivK
VRGPVPAAWVLIIDDLRDDAELWSDVCADVGLNAMTAATGMRGYRQACDSLPALILLDLTLPDIDGWEVCRLLKTNDRTKEIPIVIVTARDEPGGMRRAEESGCVAYLRKPCPPASVRAVVRGVLDGRKISDPPTIVAPMAEAIGRLKSLFVEVPGTQLSASEISRLSGLELERCEPILDVLMRTGFLTRGRDGRFRRVSD